MAGKTYLVALDNDVKGNFVRPLVFIIHNIFKENICRLVICKKLILNRSKILFFLNLPFLKS